MKRTDSSREQEIFQEIMDHESLTNNLEQILFEFNTVMDAIGTKNPKAVADVNAELARQIRSLYASVAERIFCGCQPEYFSCQGTCEKARHQDGAA